MIPQITGVAEAPEARAPKDWKAGVPEALLEADGAVRTGVTWKYGAAFEMLDYCPACGTDVLEEGKYFRCPNATDCRPQIVGRTLQLTSRVGATRLGCLAQPLERLGDVSLDRPPDR